MKGSGEKERDISKGAKKVRIKKERKTEKLGKKKERQSMKER